MNVLEIGSVDVFTFEKSSDVPIVFIKITLLGKLIV